MSIILVRQDIKDVYWRVLGKILDFLVSLGHHEGKVTKMAKSVQEGSQFEKSGTPFVLMSDIDRKGTDFLCTMFRELDKNENRYFVLHSYSFAGPYVEILPNKLKERLG